ALAERMSFIECFLLYLFIVRLEFGGLLRLDGDGYRFTCSQGCSDDILKYLRLTGRGANPCLGHHRCERGVVEMALRVVVGDPKATLRPLDAGIVLQQLPVVQRQVHARDKTHVIRVEYESGTELQEERVVS